jgi:uncharacterized protein YjbI with pentapeptide repeats
VRRRIATTSVSLCALALAIVAQSASSTGTPPKNQQVDQLFVQSAHRGTLRPTKRAGDFRLVLRRAGAHTQSIYCCIQTPDGRQVTEVHQIPTAGFIGLWRGFGFEAEHPDAVLNLLHGDPAADATALRLTHPRTSHHGRRVAYHARRISVVGSNLTGFSSGLDRQVPRRFAAASLYIDQESALLAGSCQPGVFCENVNGCEIQPYTQCPNGVFEHQQQSLISANLTEANLRHADFRGADVTAAVFKAAHLEGALFSEYQVCRPGGCYMDPASLNGADFSSADLSSADLEGADASPAEGLQTKFVDAELQHADLRDATAARANFRWADLVYADLTGANVALSDFTHANLFGAEGWHDYASYLRPTLCHTIMPDGSINNRDCPSG